MKSYPYALPIREDLLEVVDEGDRPLLLMPREEALRCKMPHRKVRVALHDEKGRILLIRPTLPQGSQAGWTLPGTRVLAGESREDAVLRVLEQELGIIHVLVEPCLEQPPPTDHSNKTIFFTGVLPQEFENAIKAQDTLLVDEDELQGLAAHFGEILTQELLHTVKSGYALAALSKTPKA